MREELFGGLKVRIVGGTDRMGGGDGPIVVLLHGFGAPGDDLVPLWRALDVPPSVRFVFPEAPVALPWQFGGGRAWWMIDMDALQRLARRVSAGGMADEIPEGMAEARQKLAAMLSALSRDKALGSGPLVLGGFSQGAMLSCDTALHSDLPLAGLVVLSGTLLAEREWVPRMATRKGLPVLQSHGVEDPLLPLAWAERLRDRMSEAGMPVEWIQFRGGHEIPQTVLDRLGRFVTRVTAAK